MAASGGTVYRSKGGGKTAGKRYFVKKGESTSAAAKRQLKRMAGK